MQFAYATGVLHVIEANPRASRTVPFVAKAIGTPIAKANARVLAGATIAELRAEGMLPEQDGTIMPIDAPVAVKEAVLPFRRFRTADGRMVDSLLGPEMRSTGEVMGIDRDFPTAFAKSQVAAYGGMPTSGTVFVSLSDRDKRQAVLPVHRLQQLGFRIVATAGTAEVLARNGIRVETVRKHSEAGVEPSIVDLIDAGEIDIIVNTPSGGIARADGYEIRASTVAADKALFTTISQLGAAVTAIEAARDAFEVTSLQEYHGRRSA